MLIVLSPAKTLDYETPIKTSKSSEPELLDRSEPLVDRARKLSVPKLAELMGISDALARENVRRYKAWSRPFTPENARQAIFAFRGDVYRGLDVDTLGARDLDWAQKRLRILSGLYGVLRPLDLMQPYRMEMGLPFAVGRQPNLYGYWGDTITETLNDAMRQARTRILVNLASKEYFNAVDPDRIDGTVVTPAFKEMRDGKLKTIALSAKRARGFMARYIIEKRLTKVEDLQGFRLERYRYRKTGSTDAAPLFVRK